MPELPEVETMRRGLIATIGGMITAVTEPIIPYRPIKLDPPIEQFRKRAVGTVVVAVDRIAKRVLVKLDTGDSIVMQPKMAGIAMVSEPPSEQHTRMVFDLNGAAVDKFLYWDRRGLGTVCLWTPIKWNSSWGQLNWGPTPLSLTKKPLWTGSVRSIAK